MDFYRVKTHNVKRGVTEVYPDFQVCRSKDLMVRGRSFYAIWDEEEQMWSTDEYDVARLVDNDLWAEYERIKDSVDGQIVVKSMLSSSTRSWSKFRSYISELPDSAKQLDNQLTFANMEARKTDYASKKLPYPLEEGSFDAFDEMIGTLYDPEERAKLEWSIGAIVAGDSPHIQKFAVLYGSAGAGKSTMLNIIQSLFEGYYVIFEAEELTSMNNSFSTEVFKSNPLVAVQHDGDLSKIEKNTKLNSIVSHEDIIVNEKYKSGYPIRANCFLFMGTNRPVKITDAKSGIIRRLIDIVPSGRRIPANHYHALMNRIEFELGAIAWHCREVYLSMGKHYYDGYQPTRMMYSTDVFFNFVDDAYPIFARQDGVSLKQAWQMYKEYCADSLVQYTMPMFKFRDELENYFEELRDREIVDGERIRNYFVGFKREKFNRKNSQGENPVVTPELHNTESLLDDILEDCLAQEASPDGQPKQKWANVTTKLKDVDTSVVHYVQPPVNHIVIDFDLTDEKGEKSEKLNLEAAGKWPPTYAEFSKSGRGVHLHYIYDGDPTELSRVYDEGIEIKVFTGNSSLRRRFTRCNDIPVATINGGLPLKEKKVINFDSVMNEKGIRELIIRNLHKEFHPGTKPSIDFINKILNDAHESGVSYDITDLRPRIMAFANNSTNQADYCLSLVAKMKYKSEDLSDEPVDAYSSDELVFFDVEVFPNLFVVCYKHQGEDKKTVRLINPEAGEIEWLMRQRLVGFNCRRYDNHILYARFLGYGLKDLYVLSQRMMDKSRNATFAEAYSLSYADVYDFASEKMSLKLWEIELGIHHQELGLPWDDPVPEEKWEEVADYCVNDVVATEAVFHARKDDFAARQILAELAGLTVNDTTQRLAGRIIFGKDKEPQKKFVYTNLATGEES